MAVSLLTRISVAFQRFEQIVELTLGRRFPSDSFCLAGIEINRNDISQWKAPNSKPFSIKDIVGDGLLWAVPKHRRSLEKRLTRRFGHPEYVMKILKPKTNIKTCNTCGDDYEAGHLCPTCYKKVIDETKQMQDAIQKELQLQPVEHEVVVLYAGEKDSKPDEFYEGKRIIEMEKARPVWFSQNLLQKTTQKPATTKDVKPSELG